MMNIKIALLVMVFYSFLAAEDILLSYRGGVYYVPVTINEKVPLEFVVDSGASLVYIPNSVFQQLRDNGSLQSSDILGKGKSQIANGDIVDILIITIKKLKIGQAEIENVKAGVGSNGSSVLLGQSALQRLEPWSIDTQKNLLKITSKSKSTKSYVSPSQEIGRTEALDFVNHYIFLQNHRSLEDVVLLYAPKVDFLGSGMVTREFIFAQKERHFREWHTIHLDLIELIEAKEPATHPKQMMVKYSVAFDRHNDFEHRGETGQMLTTLLLEKENGAIHIISEKEEIITENSY